MRIIAGRFRSRRLHTPPGDSVRPTPDRLREALFSVLAPRLEGCVFVDAYAGSGAVGLEALSRGASQVILIERQAKAQEVIRRNLTELNVTGEVTLIPGKAAVALRNFSADFVFVDPPYAMTEEYTAAFASARLLAGGWLIAQHASRQKLAPPPDRLRLLRELRQGENTLSFYETFGEL